MQNRPHSQQCPKFHNNQWLIEYYRLLRSASLLFKRLQFYQSLPIQFSTKLSWSYAPASECDNGNRPQWFTLPHGRYSPAKHHVSEVHLIGYASYFNKKSNLSSKLISRSEKLTSEQASWIFLKNYLCILRPGSNCSQVWHPLHFTLSTVVLFVYSSALLVVCPIFMQQRHFGRGHLTYPHCSWASLLGILPVLGAHSFASNWQLPFLNQRKEENGRRNYLMSNLHERMLLDGRINPATVCIPGGRASDRATTPVTIMFCDFSCMPPACGLGWSNKVVLCCVL